MSAILYLFRRKIINWFKQLRYNKSKLALIIFWGIFILFTFGSSFLSTNYTDDLEDLGEFTPVDVTGTIMVVTWTVLVIFVLITALYQGTKRGSSVFSSPDVHFIFTGPIRSQTVLTYGMLNSLSSVLISTFFMIYQLPNMRNMGLGALDFALFILSWFLIVLISQLATMSLYLLLFDHQHLSTIVRAVILLLPVGLVLVYGYLLLYGGPAFKGQPNGALMGMVSSPFILLVPLLGWSLNLMTGVLSGMDIWNALSAILLVLTALGLSVYISKSEADFYEDAMGLTYEREAQVNKQKSGQIARVRKVRKTGLNKGYGEDAIFYRQWREYRRTSPFIFTPAMLFYLMGGAMIAVFLYGLSTENEFNPANFSSLGTLIILCGLSVVMFWHGMFSSLLSELDMPTFFIAPGKPLTKLLQASRLGVLKVAIDILPSIIIATILLRLNPLIVLTLILASISVHLVISGSQLLIHRLVGKIKGTVETMLLILIQGVMMVPMITIIVIAFVLMGFDLINMSWPFFLLITLVNTVLFFCTLPAGISLLERGLER